MSHSRLDLTRLEKVRRVGQVIKARCPACAEGGGDRQGNHLAIFPIGKFGCAAMQGDKEHNRRIFALVGIAGDVERDTEANRRWRNKRDHETQQAFQKRRLVQTSAANREAIVARHQWNFADMDDDSPQRIDTDLVARDPRNFLASLFRPEVLVWTGEVFESGPKHASRWRRCIDWQTCSPEVRVGPMVTPAIWSPGSTARTVGNVHSNPFLVLDFDGVDGIKPTTERELQQHLVDSLALIRWLREGLRWRLAAIVHTGGKSLHAWFHSPPGLEQLKAVAPSLGIDAGLIGHAEHPCRLPGQRHKKTGKTSRVLWLQAQHE